MKYSFLTFLVLILSTSSVQAEQSRRGLITSGACPLSCEDLAVPVSSCKEWTVGQRCFVEDARSPAGHRSVAIVPRPIGGANLPAVEVKRPSSQIESSMNTSDEIASIEGNRRGLVTSSSCPFSCQNAGVPKADCREYRSGSNCSVEDLRQGPGHRSMIRVNQ